MNNLLSPFIVDKIERESAAGREAWIEGEIAVAEEHFLEAWNALPDPKPAQDFYGQDLSWGLTRFYQITKQFDKAKCWLEIVKQAYGAAPDASLDFLAGTLAFDAGDNEEAYRLFDNLFREFGPRPFEGSDPKYLECYRKQRLNLSKRSDEVCGQ